MKTTRSSPRRQALKAKDASSSGAHSVPTAKDNDISRGGVQTPFPWKLHEMLEDSHKEGNEWIVSWQAHGRSFTVHKPKTFVEKIMPTYFNQSKYASFQRQLNLYGFNRLTSGKDKGAYYHELFVRGECNLCRGMIRQKIKGTKVRRTLSPEEEPDFYTYKEAVTPSINCSSSMPVSESERRMETVRQVLAQTERICGDDFFDDCCGPLVSPVESDDSDSEDSHFSPALKPLDAPASLMLPPLETSVIKTEQQPKFTTTTRPRSLSSGDLLFFEGKPFHYLEHLDSLPPRSVPKASNKDSSCGSPPRDSLASLMRSDPQALMDTALNICQNP